MTFIFCEWLLKGMHPLSADAISRQALSRNTDFTGYALPPHTFFLYPPSKPPPPPLPLPHPRSRPVYLNKRRGCCVQVLRNAFDYSEAELDSSPLDLTRSGSTAVLSIVTSDW